MSEGDFDLAQFPPSYIGPTWQRGPSGRFVIPRLTLGWQVADWCTRYLLHPSGQGPWTFTPEQLRFTLWWFSLTEAGRFRYSSALLQRLKGWGKDPLAAVYALAELAGPVRFDRFDEEGFPVGVPCPNPWVEVYGVSKAATMNTMDMLPLLMSPRLKEDFSLDVGKELIRAHGGKGKLLARSGGHRSSEGGRTTAMVLGEVQHWVASNGGHSLYQTVRNNVAKTDSRFISITNAYMPGEDSIAEKIRMGWQDVQDGKIRDAGLLYDSIEAHEKTPLSEESLRQVLPLIRGDASWLNVDAILPSVLSPEMPPARSRRMWLNQIVSSDDALVTVADWDDLWVDDRIRDGEEVALGFDGGQVEDATALVAVRIRDGFVEPLLIEEKPEDWSGQWQVDRGRVDAAVRDAFRRFRVAAGFFDMRLWEAHVAAWAAEFQDQLLVHSTGLNALAWDMRGGAQKRVTRANELLVTAIRDGEVAHGNAASKGLRLTFRRHVLNVRRRENSYGVGFSKEYRHSPKKIDAYAALVAAYAARDAVRQSGKQFREDEQLWML